MKRRLLIGALLAAYLLFLVEITQRRFLTVNAEPNLVPFRTISADWRAGGREFLVGFLGNLTVFVPIGALLPLTSPRRLGAWQVGLVSLGLSLAIEAGQFASGQRVADVDDLLLNTAGGLLGYGLFVGFRRKS